MGFLSKFTSQFERLPKECLKELDTILQVKEYPKKTIITNLNEVPSKFFILKTGIIRAFVVDAKGKEYMRSLFVKSQLVGSLSALIKKSPSKFVYECFSDCEIIEGDFYQFRKATEKHKSLANLYTKVLEETYVKLDEKLSEFALLDAKDRYLNLKKRIPNIEELLPQYHIASYLSITSVQLSRIRKKLIFEK